MYKLSLPLIWREFPFQGNQISNQSGKSYYDKTSLQLDTEWYKYMYVKYALSR